MDDFLYFISFHYLTSKTKETIFNPVNYIARGTSNLGQMKKTRDYQVIMQPIE